jgi:hypothetical protein
MESRLPFGAGLTASVFCGNEPGDHEVGVVVINRVSHGRARSQLIV